MKPKRTAIHKAKRACPICDKRDVQVLHSQSFVLISDHPLADGYDVVKCQACGFIYADTSVTQEDYDLFYAQFSKYQDHQTSTGGGDNPFDRQRLVNTAKEIAACLPDRKGRIVDIGCANGGLLRELSQLGYQNLLGIDPSPVCVSNTRKIPGVEALPGSIFQLPGNTGSFDLVILSHVLEHIYDLRQAMVNLRGLLKPKGLIYVEVPDAERYVDFISAPYQDFNTEHINHFSLLSLQNLMASQGFIFMRSGKKVIQSAPDVPYPATFGFFGDQGKPGEIQKDDRLVFQINKYIKASKVMMAEIDQVLGEVLADHPDVMVWGTGQLVMKLLSDTCLKKAHIVTFIDSNPANQGREIKGIPIIAPEQITASCPIIVGSLIHYRSIVMSIKQRGLSNPIYLIKKDIPLPIS